MLLLLPATEFRYAKLQNTKYTYPYSFIMVDYFLVSTKVALVNEDIITIHQSTKEHVQLQTLNA